MKSNFYFGSSDAPYPPTFSIVSPLPLPSFSPSRETCSPLLLSSPPLYFSCLSLFRPNFSREKRLRDAFRFAVEKRFVHPPQGWITASRPGLSKTRTVSFLFFFFFPSTEIRRGKGGRRGDRSKGASKFGGSLTFSTERTWRMTERGGLIFKRWKFSMCDRVGRKFLTSKFLSSMEDIYICIPNREHLEVFVPSSSQQSWAN